MTFADRDDVTAPARFRRLLEHRSGALAAALTVSLLAHLILASLLEPPMGGPEPLPILSATITEMPPPPAPVKAPAVKRKPKPRPSPVIAITAREATIAMAASEADAVAWHEMAEPAPPLSEAPDIAAAEAPAPPPAHPIPPRIELVYRGFLGTRGFFIGDAVYRLEHEGSRYTITTVAQARGLAALFLRGEGRLSSTGTITTAGLQPDIYTAERTNDGRHEAAMFDWGMGRVFLNDNKTAPLVPPTFDPLAVLWQFYFVPPDEDQTEFNVATTRRVYHARFHRVDAEKVALPFAEVDTEVWERDGGDGNVTARVWLAPSLHHVMVKMRLSNGRITGEALLDSIRVDEAIAQQ